MTPTREEIDAARTPRGAWTKATLASWGVPWPPPKGWKARLENGQDGATPDRPFVSESDVVALLTYPLPAGKIAAVVKALEGLYGKGLLVDAGHPLAQQYMVICRPAPDAAS